MNVTNMADFRQKKEAREGFFSAMQSGGYEWFKPLTDAEKIEKGVLEMDPPTITEDAVMDTFNISKSKAYVTLRSLVRKNKIKKFGRGKSAVWKRVLVDKSKVAGILV